MNRAFPHLPGTFIALGFNELLILEQVLDDCIFVSVEIWPS